MRLNLTENEIGAADDMISASSLKILKNILSFADRWTEQDALLFVDQTVTILVKSCEYVRFVDGKIRFIANGSDDVPTACVISAVLPDIPPRCVAFVEEAFADLGLQCEYWNALEKRLEVSMYSEKEEL